MSEHQIKNLLEVSMTKVKEMLDVDVLIGEPLVMGYATVIPVSKVKCGFVSGGMDQKLTKPNDKDSYPFGGATGGSINITPVGFLVCTPNDVKVLLLEEKSHVLETLIDNSKEFLGSLIKQFNGKKANVESDNVEIITKD